MHPDVNNQPHFELPQPRTQEVPQDGEANGEEAVFEQKAEHQAAPAASASPQPTAPAVQNPLLPQVVAPMPHHAQATPQSASAASLPNAADDVDLIEKEWVERAKDIVEQTRDDPHRQNKELSKIKAEYIKKRYNKEVKVSDE